MKLKTFRAKTMADALDLVKRQFGRGAVILNTRTVSKRSVLGREKAYEVEITAARQMADLPEQLRRGISASGKDRGERAGGSAEGAAASMPSKPQPVDVPPQGELISEMGALRSVVLDLVDETRRLRLPSVPDQLYETYIALTSNAVAEKIAQSLVDQVRRTVADDQLRDPEVVRACLARGIEKMIPVAGPIRIAGKGGPTIIALVGPTGVGKTTTIAKLAANFSLRDGLKVGLITIDTYRIAAVEQLKTYAQIIDVPLEIASTPPQLRDAVDRMGDCDVVLIDTAGRSQRDHKKIEELSGFFALVQPNEMHLVLSGTGSEGVLLETIRRFSSLGIDRVIFTKLDEAIGFGVMLTCLAAAQARLSYVTTGQDVPDDVHVGEQAALARLIMGRRSNRTEEAKPVSVGMEKAQCVP